MTITCKSLFGTTLAIGSLINWTAVAQAQCSNDPSLRSAGPPLYAEGSFNSNLTGYREVLLSEGVILDENYHQPNLGPVENGQSDAHSHFTVGQVPAGICIEAFGSNSGNHGWAVGDGPPPCRCTRDGTTLRKHNHTMEVPDAVVLHHRERRIRPIHW